MKLLIPSVILLFIGGWGVFTGKNHAAEAYLWCWEFWFQLPLGALAIYLLHDLTGGKWAEAIRSSLKAMMLSFLPLVVLFIPLLFATHERPVFFAVRATLYMLVLCVLIKGASACKLRPHFSAVGLLVFVIVISLLSTDWFMARDPHWYSTVYPLILILSMVTNAFAGVLVLKLIHPPSASEDNADQGSIFLVFLVGWAYLAFMQFLIIWSANLPKEVTWYVKRFAGDWDMVILAVVMLSLIVPFFLLLNHRLKSNSRYLGLVALTVLVFRVLDAAWVILPATRGSFGFYWWDAASFMGIGGLWIWAFQRGLRRI